MTRVPAALQQTIDAGDVPGVVTMIWRKGELVQVNALGLRDIEHRLPMTRNAIFGIASMSKPVTVAAALTMVEQGRMRLDDPITRWAPEFADMRVLRRADWPLDDTYPAPRVITIADLMTHRSGFTYGFTQAGPLGPALMARTGMGIESPLSPDDWMKALASLPLAYAPDERFNYGHSMDVLGFILGRAAGTSLRQVMAERVFGPLGMADTDFWIPPGKRDRQAASYASSSPRKFMPAPLGAFTAPAPPAFTSGGQGLVSTADDYLTFARMLLGGGQVNGVRLLKPQTVRLMTANHLKPAQRQLPTNLGPLVNLKTNGFGLGVSMITDAPALAASGRGAGSEGAYTWPGAFGGWWLADPAQEMVLVWLQEVLPGAPPAPGAMPRFPGSNGVVQFQKLVYAALEA